MTTRPTLAAVLLAALPSLCLGSGYEFEGIGARQVGRAGAAVADADDWTAVYWNPAGIVRAAQKGGAEVGVEAFGGMAYSRDSNSLSNLAGVGPIFSKSRLDSGFALGALGAVIPLGEKAALGLGFYTPLLQGADFQDLSAGGTAIDYKAAAGILVWNVSGSVALSPEWSAGAGVNVLYGRIKSEVSLTNLAPFGNLHSKLAGDGTALEAVFGLRWDPRRWFSAGAVVRSGADVPIKGDAEAEAPLALPDERSPFSYTLSQPPTSDLGVALRPTEDWTLTADLHQTYWRRFSSAFRYERQGLLLQNTANTFHWRDTWKIRLGARRRIGSWELLGGYSYDRHALDSSSVDFSSAVDVPMHRLSAAVAKRWSKSFENSLGAIVGRGSRREGSVAYRLTGFQLMAESRVSF